MSIKPEPPDGTRLEFELGTDVYAVWRDDRSSAESGWPDGDGGKVWCEYGHSVPRTWKEINLEFDDAPSEFGVRLLMHPDDEAIRATWPTQRLIVVDSDTHAVTSGRED